MGIEDYYTDTVTRQTSTGTADGFGGESLTWTSQGTFQARFRDISGNEYPRYEKVSSETTHLIYCDPDETLLITDRLVVDSVTYEVTSIKGIKNKTELHHQVIELKKIE